MALATYNTYWDSVNNVPKIDPSTGKAYVFHISEGAQGGWTSFLDTNTSAASITSLIATGNPVPLSIGDVINFSSGMKTSIYGSVPANKDVLIPVTANTTPGTSAAIVAFGAVHIDFGLGGSSKYVQLYFTDNYKFSNGTPGGPRYGVYMPPKLVQ